MADTETGPADERRVRGLRLQERLESADVRLVAGVATNAANLVHAKAMPVQRTADFVASGAGESPVYAGYSVDGSIVPTRHYGPVGDLRFRLDASSVRVVGGGLALGAVDVVDQAGEIDASSPRAILGRVCGDLAAAGIDARVGHELEFVLVRPSGEALPQGFWTPYGLGPLLDHLSFCDELAGACERAAIPLQQLHAEYGASQFEVSLPPAEPVAAADSLVIVKAIIGLLARRHDLAASFSPVPFAGTVGNGAHQHVSLARAGALLFSDGARADGMHEDGASAIAGILSHLLEAQGVLTGSVLSPIRLLPGMWSGACICWGTENREASVRLIRAGPANPLGANVELKVIDPSANPYLASATLLGLALHGVRNRLELAPETTEDPSTMSDEQRAERGIRLLSRDQDTALDRLAASELMRHILGDAAVDTLVAVRRHEGAVFDGPIERVASQLRLAWTV